jgi:diguanylate cyclase (GGDEF)-like protein
LRRNELKSSVAEAERQETRALQIYGTAKSLGGSLSWEEMGPRLASAVQRLFGSFDFLLYAQDGGRLSLLQRRGTWKREPPVERVPTEAGVLRPPAAAEVSPVLVVPIQSAEKGAAGALFVKVAVDPAREREFVEIAAELGPQLAMALAKALLFRQLETQSRTDGLTGVLRRQAFTDRMDEEFKRSAVFNTNFSVLMIDIDHFKSVNDQHGHPAGDAVLARIGKVLMESFYETDVVGRYGGEEFIVLLPRSEFDGVMRKAEALRRRIESERIQTGFGPLQVTVSIGAARFPEAGRTPDDLIASADRALYRAKEGGRNRVEGA